MGGADCDVLQVYDFWICSTCTNISYVKCSIIMGDYDPYETLGVQRGASYEECQQQYRMLVKQYHPDRNDSDDAAERLQRIRHSWDYIQRQHKSSNKSDTQDTEYPQYYNSDGTMKSNSARQTRANPYKPGKAARRQAALQKRNKPKSNNTIKCTSCDGRGYITRRFLFIEKINTCKVCRGTGLVPGKVNHTVKKDRRLSPKDKSY